MRRTTRSVVEEGEPTDPVDVPEDSPALIMYTSGTTGRPKGAVLSHQNLLSRVRHADPAYELCSDDEVDLFASPMFHIARIGSIAPLMLIGGTMVILPPAAFDPPTSSTCSSRSGSPACFLVPTQWQAVCAQPDIDERDLSLLRTHLVGRRPGHRRAAASRWGRPSPTR